MRRALQRIAIIAAALFAAVPTATARDLAPIRAEVFAQNLWIPIAMIQDPAQANVQYVLLQGGIIRVIRNGSLLQQEFLNIRPQVTFFGEMGCLGLAFAPDYATSGRFYVLFNSSDPEGALIIARFKRSATNPWVADPSSQFNLMFDGNPYIQRPPGIHNGGTMIFGPDGYLYFGIGETGLEELSQDPTSLHGKIHRIDVNVPDEDPIGYRIPLTNPFLPENNPPVANARPEFWHVGLRNPWKWCFDDRGRGHTNAMIIGDVGGAHYEEIDIAPAGVGGLNYGWPIYEAFQKLSNLPPMFLPLSEPVYAYPHFGFNSITGGYVLRNGRQCSYFGRYFFADFGVGQVYSGRFTGDAIGDIVDHTNDLFGSERFFIPSFGRDAEGNLYVLRYDPGTIYKIVTDELPFLGDINSDGGVDSADLFQILSYFGSLYNTTDLIHVLGNFGVDCGE
ncbi:MAG: sorbosone dehydrogenase family protein [Phycisphaerales bacterium]